MPEIRFPDGASRSYPDGVTGFDIAEDISKSLAKKALAVEVDGELRDLKRPVEADSEIRIITARDPEGLELIRHDAAHVLAEAVQEAAAVVRVEIQAAFDERSTGAAFRVQPLKFNNIFVYQTYTDFFTLFSDETYFQFYGVPQEFIGDGSVVPAEIFQSVNCRFSTSHGHLAVPLKSEIGKRYLKYRQYAVETKQHHGVLLQLQSDESNEDVMPDDALIVGNDLGHVAFSFFPSESSPSSEFQWDSTIVHPDEPHFVCPFDKIWNRKCVVCDVQTELTCTCKMPETNLTGAFHFPARSLPK